MDTLGEVIVCGALTDGVLLPQKQLRGKKIRNICGGFDHLAVLFDNYAIEWITEMDLKNEIAQELNDVKLKELAFGAKHVSSISLDGHLYTWGDGNEGQLGSGTFVEYFPVPQRVHKENVAFSSVHCGGYHAVALSDSKDMYSWGRGFEGQTGLAPKSMSNASNEGLYGIQPIPRNVGTLLEKKVVDVSCGDSYTTIVTGQGQVWAFGEAQSGQLGQGRCSKQMSPTCTIKEGHDGSKFVKVSCGWAHTLALTDSGALYAWGFNVQGQLGVGDTITKYEPQIVVEKSNIKQIYTGSQYSISITDSGGVATWGSGRYGKLGHDTEENQSIPKIVEHLKDIYVCNATCSKDNLLLYAPSWVTDVYPKSGPTLGGTVLTIVGTGFWESDDITIRFTPDTEDRLVRASLGTYDPATGKITCDTPKFALPGLVHVEVSMNGKHFTTNGFKFDTFVQPEAIRVDPPECRMSKQNMIKIDAIGIYAGRIPALHVVERNTNEVLQKLQGACEMFYADSQLRATQVDEKAPDMYFTRMTFTTEVMDRRDIVFANLSLGLNAVDIIPLQYEENRASIIFHEAHIDNIVPNLALRDCTGPVDIAIRGSHFFNIDQSIVHFQFDGTPDDPIQSASTTGKLFCQSSTEMTCRILPLEQWTVVEHPKVEVDDSDDENSDAEWTVEHEIPWWQKLERITCKLFVSLNDNRCQLPIKDDHFRFILQPTDMTSIHPPCGPITGKTKVSFPIPKSLAFTPTCLKLLVSYEKAEHHTDTVELNSNTPDSTAVFILPALNFLALAADSNTTSTQEVEDAETTEPLETEKKPALHALATLHVALDGTSFVQSSLQFQYYVLPTMTRVDPTSTTMGSTVEIYGEHFLDTKLIRIRLLHIDSNATTDITPTFISHAKLRMTIPDLSDAFLGACQLWISLNNQQFHSSSESTNVETGLTTTNSTSITLTIISAPVDEITN